MVDRSRVLSIASSLGFQAQPELMSLLELSDWKDSLQLDYCEDRAVQNMGQCSCLISDVPQGSAAARATRFRGKHDRE
jgi:hypothetical protein